MVIPTNRYPRPRTRADTAIRSFPTPSLTRDYPLNIRHPVLTHVVRHSPGGQPDLPGQRLPRRLSPQRPQGSPGWPVPGRRHGPPECGHPLPPARDERCQSGPALSRVSQRRRCLATSGIPDGVRLARLHRAEHRDGPADGRNRRSDRPSHGHRLVRGQERHVDAVPVVSVRDAGATRLAAGSRQSAAYSIV